MPISDIQANAAALVAAMTNPQADRITPSCQDEADYMRTLTISGSEAQQYIFKAPPLRPVLRMYNASGQYGTLRFDENGKFQFEGDASASARVLFDEMKRLAGG